MINLIKFPILVKTGLEATLVAAVLLFNVVAISVPSFADDEDDEEEPVMASPASDDDDEEDESLIASSSSGDDDNDNNDNDNNDNDNDDEINGKLVVDDDKVQCPNAAYMTIQDAVDDAAVMPGTQSIRICEGMYPENVTVGSGNSLEIFGDGTSKTFVKGVAGTAGPIFDVTNAGKVSIKKLTVDGMSAMAGGVVWGIRYIETDGAIEHVAVLNIRNADGGSQGLGIRVQSSGPATNVKIEHNLVQGSTRVGIIANGLGVKAYIEDNKVIGPVLPKVWAANGIQVSRGAVGYVENNMVSGMTSPNVPGGAGSGIILFCAGPTEVKKNKVSASDLGIALGDNSNAEVTHNMVRDSLFDAYSLQFIGTLFGPLGCPSFPSPTENNLLEDNKAINSAENGISLAGFDPDDLSIPMNNDIVENNIKSSGIDGIHVFGEASGNEFIENKIRNSTNLDAVDESTGAGTAGTANTWDDNDCSTSSPAGLC